MMQAETSSLSTHLQSAPVSWLDRPVFKDSAVKIHTLIAIFIIILTLLSRFAMLGARVMSHDEVNHVVPSWELYTGKGYAHSPVTHGPFQFHIVALSYFLMGDSDFSSRVPAALFSTAAILFILFAFPRYIGRSGAIFAALFFLISPFMLFYGRYTRNEGFIELYGVVMLFAVLRHMEKGDKLSLFLLTGTLVFHLITKETAWIYAAQLLVFLAFLFLMEVQRVERFLKGNLSGFWAFFGLIAGAMVSLLAAIAFAVMNAKPPSESAGLGSQATVEAASGAFSTANLAVEAALVLLAIALGTFAFIILLRDSGWNRLRHLRSFNLLILAATLILPQLTAFPVKMIGWDPLDYSTTGMLRTGVFLGFFILVSAAIGLLWNRRLWLQNAIFFYAVYVFFYTTMFTNGNGFFTGIVGSLGYWLSQQGVNRGSQPSYYFALIQMPVYEYLAVLGSILAVYFGLRHNRLAHLPGLNPSDPHPGLDAADSDQPAEGQLSSAEPEATNLASSLDNDKAAHAFTLDLPSPRPDFSEHNESDSLPPEEPRDSISSAQAATLASRDLEKFYSGERPLPVLFLLIYWGITSLIAYSLAGEKMPWLTVHITLGFLLAAGWGLGFLVDTTRWRQLITRPTVIALLLLPILFTSAAGLVGSLLGTNPPFAGNTLQQLQATNNFIFSVIAFLATSAGIIYILRSMPSSQILRLFTVGIFAILIVLTARAAYRASFINYDNAKEFLVYAHAARGPKDVLAQIEEISMRITKGKDLAVAYSGDGLYPYWWYLRDYPNHRWFGNTPTRDLKDVPVIIAGEDALNKMPAIVGNNYVKFTYMRLWWPMQGYYNLTGERIWNALTNPDMREALWQIWFNRDYTLYAQVTGDTGLTLENWNPSARMDVYIRKDVISQMWNYGAAPAVMSEVEPDPYEGKILLVNAELIIGGASGSAEPSFNAPRGLALGPDGTLYIADSRNNRIVHLNSDGSLINTWGMFSDAAAGDAAGGTFNEPWDVAVGPDGSVYVSDTWNHRIQRFDSSGRFLSMWGYFGQAETPEGFWGPRGLAIDSRGRIYVTDTGNKRVVVFEADGAYVTQFGSVGLDVGQFDEPVGLAIGPDDQVYVADTWNQRIQVFQPDDAGLVFTPVRQWDINGWLGQSLENKPFIEVSPLDGNVYVADPEGSRVLVFDSDGNFLTGWGNFGSGADAIGMASGVAVSADGKIWVSDGTNNRVMRFLLP